MMSFDQDYQHVQHDLRNLPPTNLTTEQKQKDFQRIQQHIGYRETHKKRKRIYAISLSCCLVIFVASFGVWEVRRSFSTSVHNGVSTSALPVGESPVSPEVLSNDAVTMWKYGNATHAFVAYDGNFYVTTGRLVKHDEELSTRLGQLKMGDSTKPWENFQSNYFVGALYALQGIDPHEEIAVQFWSDKNKGSTYGIFKRDTPIGNPDPKTITSAKNDAATVKVALQNTRDQFMDFYEFKGHEDQVTMIAYEPFYGPGARMTYRLSSNQFVNIFEYKSGVSNASISNIPTLPDQNYSKQNSFDSNGIHWTYYNNNFLRGERGDYLYELQDGNLSIEQAVKILHDFQTSDKNN